VLSRPCRKRTFVVSRILTRDVKNDQSWHGWQTQSPTNPLSPILLPVEYATDCRIGVSGKLDSLVRAKTLPFKQYNAESQIASPAAPHFGSCTKYVSSLYELLAILPWISRFEGCSVRFHVSAGHVNTSSRRFYWYELLVTSPLAAQRGELLPGAWRPIFQPEGLFRTRREVDDRHEIEQSTYPHRAESFPKLTGL
jgi:hypothetical protein